MTQDLMTAVEEFRRLAFRQPVVADIEEGDAEPMEAFQASEYLVFVQALDVYSRHLEKTIEFKIVTLTNRRDTLMSAMDSVLTGGGAELDTAQIEVIDGQLTQLEASRENPVDEVVQAGVRLLRRLDAELSNFTSYMETHLPSELHPKLSRAVRRPARSAEGAAFRARSLRGVLTRGGPATLKGVFGKQIKLRKQVQEALSAVQMEDGDAALQLLAKIPIRHPKIRAWIDWADRAAKPLNEEEFFPVLMAPETPSVAPPPPVAPVPAPPPVQVGAAQVSTNAETLMAQQARELGSSDPNEVKEAKAAQTEVLAAVQQEATEEAAKALAEAGAPDEPPKRSEVVGIATAAAMATVTDPSNPQNVPATLKMLDDEQRMAALTDGKVLVAASAGSGKTRTAIARISHLVLDRGVEPLRILATTFNAKAGDELAERLIPILGEDTVKRMKSEGRLGTLHSVFRRVIQSYGNFNEQISMREPAFKDGGDSIGRAVNRVWKACYGEDKAPKLQDMMLRKSQWAGNDISPAQAMKGARSRQEQIAAMWYDWYENFKKASPRSWAPPCEEKQKNANRGPTQWERFLNKDRTVMVKGRPQVVPAGDFDDMLSTARNILRRSPEARRAVQGALDHIIVDECQDLNSIQHEVISYITEHVSSDGSDGRSLWMVGDDKQSIYSFRGAKPEKFIALNKDETYKTQMIRTNYRCEPEIVDSANQLIANNEDQIPMEANANPARKKGNGSILVERPLDEAQAAIAVADRVRSSVDRPDGDRYSDHAVLTRTNAELNAYETACIVRGIPYQRKGRGGFLSAPETQAVLGYVDLVEGTDFEAQQKSLAKVIDYPARFFQGKEGPKIIERVFADYARHIGEDRKSISPMRALNDPVFLNMASQRLAKKNPERARQNLETLRDDILEMQADAGAEGATIQGLFDSILSLSGRAMTINPETGRAEWKDISLRETLQAKLQDASSDEEDDSGNAVASIAGEDLGLGNISFLYKLAEVDPTDPEDAIHDPSTPAGFQAKMARYQARADALRVPTEGERRRAEREGKSLPEAPKDYMALNTVHSTKGLEWKNVYLPMPDTKFPLPVFGSRGEEDFEALAKEYGLPPLEPPSGEFINEADKKLQDERRLGYVAITRAEKNLMIICPTMVDGKPANPSPFIQEAGLVMGENVTPTGTEAETAVEVNEVTKTASWGSFGDDEDYDEDSEGPSDPIEASIWWGEGVNHGR